VCVCVCDVNMAVPAAAEVRDRGVDSMCTYTCEYEYLCINHTYLYTFMYKSYIPVYIYVYMIHTCIHLCIHDSYLYTFMYT